MEQRLIDANALKEYIDCGHLRNPCEVCFSELDVVNLIDKQPTIEAEPVRHGKWLNANDGRWNACEVLMCSECGEIDNRMHKTDNYCPNCGCKMDAS